MRKDWRVQTFEDREIEREMESRRKVFTILDRQEEEFENKRAWDDFLEMREVMIMDLFLRTNVAEVNQKLRDYQLANGINIDKTDDGTRAKVKLARKVDEDYPDRSGLIEGLKRIVIPEPIAPYDPFDGMPKTWDYFTITDEYELGYDQYKKDQALLAGGYSLHEALEESLVRAFAGFGVFVDEEKAQDASLRSSLTVT